MEAWVAPPNSLHFGHGTMATFFHAMFNQMDVAIVQHVVLVVSSRTVLLVIRAGNLLVVTLARIWNAWYICILFWITFLPRHSSRLDDDQTRYIVKDRTLSIVRFYSTSTTITYTHFHSVPWWFIEYHGSITTLCSVWNWNMCLLRWNFQRAAILLLCLRYHVRPRSFFKWLMNIHDIECKL